jgi:hypothetical protein
MTNWREILNEAFRSAVQQSGVPADIEAILDTLDRLTPESFVSAFESARFPQSSNRARRQTGAFYTPPLLIEPILEHALIPIIGKRVKKSLGWEDDSLSLPSRDDWSTADRDRAAQAILSITVLDPACGPGLFLRAAGELLADRLTWVRHGTNATAEDRQESRRLVAERCLSGVDIDPSAISAARIYLHLWADPKKPHGAGTNLVVGDGLGPIPPSVLHGEFDVVIGNPPFANAIEKQADRALGQAKELRSAAFADLGGTADLAYYFLVRSHELAVADGAVGLVMPRAFLSTRSCQSLRGRLVSDRPPTLLFAPASPYLFPPANIFVAAVVLRRTSLSGGQSCWGGIDRLEPVVITGDNWWHAMTHSLGLTASSPARVSGKRLGDQFEIIASMTTGIAYDLSPFVREARSEEIANRSIDGPIRLVTTGLIEPGTCEWGKRTCRYLKQDYQHPVIESSADSLPAVVRQRLKKVARPKVLVAGLSTRVEAFLDEQGIHAGAVSTYSLFDRNDDVDQLRRLCDYLNSDAVCQKLTAELGATALGGGRITLTKAFLSGLDWPSNEKAQPV